MSALDLRDIGLRALKTGVQAFLAVASVTVIVSGDLPGLRAAAVAGLAAAISVVHNALLQWSSKA